MIVAALLIHLALAQSPARPLLDVPFVAQTPELCGGAAISMVFRYWGQGDVFPQDFAPLVSQSDGGILTSVLAKSVIDRGWSAIVDPASAADAQARVRSEIDRGRPIVALIEVAPRTYHYVVIVGRTEKDVVFHDPARSPFRVLDWASFDRAWARANRWMMVVLPPAGLVAPKSQTDEHPSAGRTATWATACSDLVVRAIDAALAGRKSEAEGYLVSAQTLCPTDAAVWREYAGLQFSNKNYAAAAKYALIATRLAQDDTYAWDLMATSRYLSGDVVGALGAWNHISQPKVDEINIYGAERTHLPVVVEALDLAPRSTLTLDSFMRALRRLSDLPVAATAQLKVEPVAGGRANVVASLVERTPFPRGRSNWLVVLSRPAVQREVRVDISGLAGAGESGYAAWRFARHRPRVSAGLAFPSPGLLPGVTSFSAMWEEQNYIAPLVTHDTPFRETRRRAGLQLSDWASSWLKWQVGAAFDRFNETTHFSADASLMARSFGDRAAFAVSAGSWSPFSDGRRFAATGVRATVRFTVDAARPMFSATAEFQRTTANAPLALWPSAGTGVGSERASSLRGHQLIEDGFVSGEAFGRQLVNGTVEYSQPVSTIRAAVIALAGFVDTARPSMRRGGLAASPTYVDAGVGLRVKFPGRIGGIRIDIAHPIGDGRLIYSAGWLPVWPR